MSTFKAPVWDASQAQYNIQVTAECACSLGVDKTGAFTFKDSDELLNITDNILHALIAEGAANKWFARLPTHEQLMKRVKHSFATLPGVAHTDGVLSTIWMTPKQVTFIWRPEVRTQAPPPLEFEDSEDEDTASIKESSLPPVALVNGPNSPQNKEQYLLTRLRAAKARVEAEQIRMEYYEATGRMPPDSESDEEDDEY